MQKNSRTFLSPKELALATNRSESCIKRWVDSGKISAEKTEGGHRKIILSEAIRLIRSQKIKLVNPEILGFPQLPPLPDQPDTPDDCVNRLIDYLTNEQPDKARGFLLHLYLQGWSIADICDGPIRRAMERVGELWEKEDTGIALEHRATDMCIQALNDIRGILPDPTGNAVALGGAPSGDPYLLPSLSVATTLRAEGLQSINYGPNTPCKIFHHAIQEHTPLLVWLSISHKKHGVNLATDITKLAQCCQELGCKLLLGGNQCDKENYSTLPNTFYMPTLRELVAFVRGMDIHK
jgi:MerR family transcriptional regulator, light-induced transcriptional regulator